MPLHQPPATAPQQQQQGGGGEAARFELLVLLLLRFRLAVCGHIQRLFQCVWNCIPSFLYPQPASCSTQNFSVASSITALPSFPPTINELGLSPLLSPLSYCRPPTSSPTVGGNAAAAGTSPPLIFLKPWCRAPGGCGIPCSHWFISRPIIIKDVIFPRK